jgi:hypothetical protein
MMHGQQNITVPVVCNYRCGYHTVLAVEQQSVEEQYNECVEILMTFLGYRWVRIMSGQL